MASNMAPTNQESLVQFSTPMELAQQAELAKVKTLTGKRKVALPPMETKPDMETILNSILPPREWDHEGKHFVQYVSHNNASREDVANLQKLLDERLLARQARESGICPIREELHSQCFDEIIRQVTIDCPERGLLLMRVRDELKMTIAAYQTLYKSAVAFGMRKQIQAEQGKKELEDQISSLEARKKDLEERKVESENKKKTIERRIDERRNQEMLKRNTEIDFLNYQNEHLRAFYNNLQSSSN
jgi:dynein light intermediate chain